MAGRVTPLRRHVTGAPEEQRGPVGPGDALRAARRRFIRLERVDMNELATDLGVGRATLYRWVGDRDQLLGEVIWSMAERGLEQARARAKGTGVDWFLSAYREFGDGIVESAPMRHFVETEPECALRVMTSKSSPLQQRVIDAFRDLLLEAEAKKKVQLRLDADTLAFVLVRIAETFLWTDLITGEEPDLTKAHDVARVLLS